MEHCRRKKGLGIIVFLLILAAVIAVVMLLWNALLPAVFGVAAINYWQAAGFLILARLLFGGFGKSGRGGYHHFHGMHHPEKERFFDKMRGMSRQERLDFIRRRMTERDDEGNEEK
jgi:hypothetical protein